MVGCSSRRSGAESDSLKSRIAEPSPRPASGSRFGPSTISATARIRSRWVGLSMFWIIRVLLVWGLARGPVGLAPRHVSEPCGPIGWLLALRGVRGLRQRLDAGEEIGRLSPEQPHGRQARRRAHGNALGVGEPDDRADRELAIEELRRLGHDPIRLEQRPSLVQVWERESGGGVGQRRSVAGLVLPRLEVHRLRRADAEQYA